MTETTLRAAVRPATARPSTRRGSAVFVLAVLLLCCLAAGDAAAAGYVRFQHGGRGISEVGALTARADSPLAVRYNPAGITELPGLEIEGGIDFSNAVDEYTDASGGYEADHSIQLPPFVYLTWSDPERLGDWAVGLGIDTAEWYRVDWFPVFFPLREATRLNDVNIWEVHPVLAYRLSDQWSFGGGLRYDVGTQTWGTNRRFDIAADEDGPFHPVEYLIDADSDIDGYGFDLGAQYRSTLWGFGALFRSKVELDGSGDLAYELRDPPADASLTPAALDIIRQRPRGFDSQFDLPREISGGLWFAPYPELRFEADAVWTAWSDTSQIFTGSFVELGPGNFRRFPVDLHAGWDDTLSVRVAVEGDLSDFVVLSGGVAWEPSPVPGGHIAPAWPRGDAIVYALGVGFRYQRVTFDLGYAFHDHGESSTRVGATPGTFSGQESNWSVSAPLQVLGGRDPRFRRAGSGRDRRRGCGRPAAPRRAPRWRAPGR